MLNSCSISSCFFLSSTLLSTFDHFLTPRLASVHFCLFFPPSFAPLVRLYWSSLKGVMKKIIARSLADNSLAVPQIALMLSPGLAQSAHSVFYPLNLQPQPLSLALSNSTYVFSLLLLSCLKLLLPPSSVPLQSPSLLLPSCLSPLTSFFSLLLQVLFFSLSSDAR